MSKKNAKIAPATDVPEAQVAASAAADGAEAKAPAAPKTRGPRGTSEDAKITLVATANPKRPASKAFGVFASYVDGMTVKEFCDLNGKEATGHLVYDAKHGSISIEGYDPGAIVVPKPKAPAKPKAEKKVKAAKAPADPAVAEAKEALEAEVATETMD